MKMKTKKNWFAVGLGYGIVIVLIGAASFWIHGRHYSSGKFAANPTLGVKSTEKLATLDGIEKSEAEMEHLKPDRRYSEPGSAEMNGDLTSVRLQLDQIKKDQASMARYIDQLSRASLEKTEVPAPQEEGASTKLTPEEVDEQAQAVLEAQVQFIEETILAEEIDTEWSSWAELALIDACQSENMTGFDVVDVECRTTACRVEISLDGSVSPEEGLHNLSFVEPWDGASFTKIDVGVEPFQAVVYLAREGHSLPQW
jgi:hypothetical protein